MMLGLRTTIYKVANIEEAKQWYSLAFKTKPYFDEPFYVGFNIGGFELGLQPNEKIASLKSASVIAYWGVEDINDTFNYLLEIGGKSHNQPTNVGGPIMVASILDPWNNVIGIIYNPEFKLPS